MNLDDLTPLAKYNEDQGLTYRETLAKALAGKIDIFYVFDGRSLIIYEPIDDSYKGQGSKKNTIGGPDDIEIEYTPCDTLQLTPTFLRELWGAVFNEEFTVKLIELFYERVPEGFKLSKMLDGHDRDITTDNLYVNENSQQESKASSSTTDKPSNTSLKVIGLLMHHLAKSPRYASGTSPNKSQIKELLIDLAAELDINNYGLSKVDERLLADAMNYLEDQKN
jgi:hypothetical protein